MKEKYSNYSSVLTYNETGFTDYSDLFDTYDDAYTSFEQDAGYILSENLVDRNARAGFALAGWNPDTDTGAQAIEYFNWGIVIAPS